MSEPRVSLAVIRNDHGQVILVIGEQEYIMTSDEARELGDTLIEFGNAVDAAAEQH